MPTTLRPFEVLAATSNVAVTAASQALALTGSGIGNRTVRLANIGLQTIFFKFGVAATTAAAATSTPMLPNSVETFYLRPDITHVAVIAGNTGSTLYATIGEGA